MAYVGSLKERLTLTVTLTNKFEYSKPDFTGWKTEYHTIYIFTDADGNVFKVDTTSTLAYDPRSKEEKDNWEGWDKVMPLNCGDVVTLKGTVKDHREYKEVPQTILQRVNVTAMVERAETPEEREERLQREKEEAVQSQKDSITAGDQIITMSYKNYKEHYSDCETVIGSFEGKDIEKRKAVSTIDVIVREGRMKASGVRGQHFHGYQFRDKITGKTTSTYRAVCVENALKRCQKDYPEFDLECDRIYR